MSLSSVFVTMAGLALGLAVITAVFVATALVFGILVLPIFLVVGLVIIPVLLLGAVIGLGKLFAKLLLAAVFAGAVMVLMTL